MPRHASPDLRKDWKISLPATLAGAAEYQLFDPVTKKPRYGQRSKLIARLLARWIADCKGEPPIPTDMLDPDLEATLAPKEPVNV